MKNYKLTVILLTAILLTSSLNSKCQDTRKQEVHIIPSTHWDRVWLQPYEVNRLRLLDMMDELIDVMEKKPDFKYFTLDGQITLLSDYLELRPENTERVKKLIKDGKLLVGPWFTQPNVFMVSGESIIRNLYFGITKGAEYGPVMSICYLPDCFGMNSQLPQLVKGFGLTSIYFQRGIPSSYFGVFNWQGSDKTECLTIAYPYMLGNQIISRPSINTEAERTEFINGFNNYVSRDMQTNKTPYSVIVNGGDMVGATSDLPEKVNLINSGNAYHAKVSNFLLLLNDIKTYYEKNKIPFKTYSGEIREHKGPPIITASQSTRTDLKMANRRAEGIMEKYAEPISSFAWLSGFRYPQPELNKGWFYLLNNQHHDNTAGASHDNDHIAVLAAMDRVDEIGSELSRKNTSLISQNIFRNNPLKEKEIGFVVFNTLGWKRSGVQDIMIDIPDNSGIVNPVINDGANQYILYPEDIQINRANGLGKRFRGSIPLMNIPAMGYKTFRVSDNNTRNKSWEAHRASLLTGPGIAENEYIKVKVNFDGSLTVFDKTTGTTYPQLNYFHDDGEAGSGFEHRRPMKEVIITTIDKPAAISVTYNTPFKLTYRIETELIVPEKLEADRLRRSERMTSCKIISFVSITKGSPRIDVSTTINNTAKDHRIRASFPTFLSTSVSYAEQVFDVVKRPVAYPPEQIQNEGNLAYPVDDSWPQHSFVDLSDGKKGLMVVNKGLPLYEVSNDSTKTIFIDLMRCLDNIHNGSLGEQLDLLIHSAQMIGQYTFDYSVIPHSGNWESALRSAYEFQYPLKLSAYTGGPSGAESIKKNETVLPPEHSFIDIDNEMIVVSALKKHENNNALVLRLYNPTDRVQETAVRINPLKGEIAEVNEADMMEQILPSKSYNRSNIRLKFQPKKIITLVISMKE